MMMNSLVDSRRVATAKRPSFVTRLFAMAVLARQRRALAVLDPHQLADIGITPEEAAKESARAPWDAPANWRA